MISKVLWLSIIASALARPPNYDDFSPLPLDSKDPRQRSARSIWPFVSSETTTEAPVTHAPLPAPSSHDWFTQGETALPEGIDLTKYPVWRVHKYNGIDLQPVYPQPGTPYPEDGATQVTGYSSGSSSSSDFDQSPYNNAGVQVQNEPSSGHVVYPPERLTYQNGEQGSNYFRDSVNNRFNVQSQQNYPAFAASRPEDTTSSVRVQQTPQSPPNPQGFHSLQNFQNPQLIQSVTYEIPEHYRPDRQSGPASVEQAPKIDEGAMETSRASSSGGNNADLSFLNDLGGLASFLPDQPATPQPQMKTQEGSGDLSFLNDLGGLSSFLPEPKEDTKNGGEAVQEEKPGFFQNIISKFTGKTTNNSPSTSTSSASSGMFPSIFGQKQSPAVEVSTPAPSSGNIFSSLFYQSPTEETPPAKTYFLPQTRGSYIAVKIPNSVASTLPATYTLNQDTVNIPIHEAPRVPFYSQEIPTISAPVRDSGYHYDPPADSPYQHYSENYESSPDSNSFIPNPNYEDVPWADFRQSVQQPSGHSSPIYETLPLQSSFESHPPQSSFEARPVPSSFETQSDRVSFGPPQASLEAHPVRTTFETRPIQASFEAHPIQTSSEANSLQTSLEAHPVRASFEAHPIRTSLDANPIQTSLEAHPVRASFEAHPIRASLEANPAQTPLEAHPVQATFETRPIQTSFESHPIQTSFEASPVQTPLEAHPVRASLEAHPVQATFETHPIQASFEAHPIQTSLEANSVQTSLGAHPVRASFETNPSQSFFNGKPEFESPVSDGLSHVAVAENNFVVPSPESFTGFKPSGAFEIHITSDGDQHNYNRQDMIRQNEGEILRDNGFPPNHDYSSVSRTASDLPQQSGNFYASLPARDAYQPYSFRPTGGNSRNQDNTDTRFVQNLSDLTSYGTPTSSYSNEPFVSSASSENRKVVRFEDGRSNMRNDEPEELSNVDNDDATRRSDDNRHVNTLPVRQSPTEETDSFFYRSETDSIKEAREGRRVDGTKVIDGYSKVQRQQHPSTDLANDDADGIADSTSIPRNHKF